MVKCLGKRFMYVGKDKKARVWGVEDIGVSSVSSVSVSNTPQKTKRGHSENGYYSGEKTHQTQLPGAFPETQRIAAGMRATTVSGDDEFEEFHDPERDGDWTRRS